MDTTTAVSFPEFRFKIINRSYRSLTGHKGCMGHNGGMGKMGHKGDKGL